MNLVYFLKFLHFVSKESLNIPEYRSLFICHEHHVYTMEHAVENMAYSLYSLIFEPNRSDDENRKSKLP